MGGWERRALYLIQTKLRVLENVQNVVVAHHTNQVLVGEEVGTGLLDPFIVLFG